ncbi:hypothetical protein D1872_241650 [compost metagenome]
MLIRMGCTASLTVLRAAAGFAGGAGPAASPVSGTPGIPTPSNAAITRCIPSSFSSAERISVRERFTVQRSDTFRSTASTSIRLIGLRMKNSIPVRYARPTMS